MARRCGDHMKPVKQSRNPVCISAGVTAPHQWATSMTSALPRCLHARVDFLLSPISQQVDPFLSLLHVCFSARNHQKIKGHCCFGFFFKCSICLFAPESSLQRVSPVLFWHIKLSITSIEGQSLLHILQITILNLESLNHPEREELCSVA